MKSGVKRERLYKVYVFHYPAEPETALSLGRRELWLGYTTSQGAIGKKHYVGSVEVLAITWARAIAAGIAKAKKRVEAKAPE